MLKILIAFFLAFSLMSCNYGEDKVIPKEIEISELVAYRARSPTRLKRHIMRSIRSYYIHFYLLSGGFGFSEGSQIVSRGFEPLQRTPNKNRRDFNFT